MFLQVYSHKTVVGFDVILENALAELPQFSIDPTLDEYVTWSDDWLLRLILENRSSRWGRHIADRLPLKHLFTVRPEHQKDFEKFIAPFERSQGTTAWFPSLKNRDLKVGKKEIPKIWWRPQSVFLTKEERGRFPIYLEDSRKLVPIETQSILLSSDYMRRFDMTHVYCLREDSDRVVTWLLEQDIPEHIFKLPRTLISG